VSAGREAVLRFLQQAAVDFVLIGGAAIQSHDGVTYRTDDVDVTLRRTQANLERLAQALNALNCQLVVDPTDRSQDVPLPAGYFTAANLARQSVWNLRTPYGDLDIPFAPAGFPHGYEDLCARAQQLRVAETSVTACIAALADVEHSKRTAARPKDVRYLSDVGRLPAPTSTLPLRADPPESSGITHHSCLRSPPRPASQFDCVFLSQSDFWPALRIARGLGPSRRSPGARSVAPTPHASGGPGRRTRCGP